MPNPVARVVAKEEQESRDETNGDAENFPADPEALLWLCAPLLADFSIEALDFSEMGEISELAKLRMQRAVFGKESLELWERDESEGDLFADAQSGSQFAEADTLHFLFSAKPNSATGSIGPVARIGDSTQGLSRFTVSFSPQVSLTGPVANRNTSAFFRDSGMLHLASNSAASALAREPPRTMRLASVPGVFAGGGASLAVIGSDERLPIEQVHFEKVPQKNWGPTKNVLAIGNYLVTADRSLAALKLDGVGDSWDKEGYDLGRVINLDSHMLTFTGAGILSVGEKRDKIWNGTLATTRDNFEIHVTGGGPGYGGLEIGAVLINGASSNTGLVKTGDGELILSNQTKNTFTGEVRVERGTLTLRSKDGAIASKTIFVGDGSGPAILNLKGGRDHINPEATVTLRGGDEGEAAVLRFEKTHPKKGVVQSLEKLVIEGSGVIEFIDPFTGDGKGTSPNKNALYIDELDLQGELTIRGWEEHDTQIFIKRSVQPDAELLAKIHVEGHANLRVSQTSDGYWSLEAAPIPEPAVCGAVVMAGALALTARRKSRRLFLLAGRSLAARHLSGDDSSS